MLQLLTTHCLEYQQGEIDLSNFLICGTDNLVKYYGKRIEMLQGCPFEGWPNRAQRQPSHPFWQKLADWLNWPCPVRSALKRTTTSLQDFTIAIITRSWLKTADFALFIFLDFRSVSPEFFLPKRTWRDNWIEIPNRSPKLFSCNGDIFLFLKDVGEVVKDKILSLVWVGA